MRNEYLKCKNCGGIIPDIVASYEDDFCCKECYEEYNQCDYESYKRKKENNVLKDIRDLLVADLLLKEIEFIDREMERVKEKDFDMFDKKLIDLGSDLKKYIKKRNKITKKFLR